MPLLPLGANRGGIRHGRLSGAQQVGGLRWLDGTVCLQRVDRRAVGLYLQTVGGEAQVLASGLSEAVTFDAQTP